MVALQFVSNSQLLRDSTLPKMPVVFGDGKYEYSAHGMQNWDCIEQDPLFNNITVITMQ